MRRYKWKCSRCSTWNNLRNSCRHCGKSFSPPDEIFVVSKSGNLLGTPAEVSKMTYKLTNNSLSCTISEFVELAEGQHFFDFFPQFTDLNKKS